MNERKIGIFSIISIVFSVLSLIFVLIAFVGVPVFISLTFGVFSIIFGIIALILKDKISIPIISIILSTFVIIFASMLIITLPIINDIKQKIKDGQYSTNNTNIMENTNTINSQNANTIQNDNTINTYKTNTTSSTEQRIGNSDFGYVTVPKNWAKFYDPDSPNVLQYSYANVSIVTLYAMDTTQASAYDYATSTMYRMESQNAENVTGARVTLGKYNAYQVYGYYSDENKWLVCWHFEAEDGKTHYISVEGPDSSIEYFDIPDTFSLNY